MTETTSDSAERGRHGWNSAIVMGVAFAAGAMAYSLWLAAPFFGRQGWFVPADIWMTVNGGRYVWAGALGYVYQGTTSYSFPLSFIAMAPISGLIDHYGLIEGAPFTVARPSAWLLVGPFSLMFGIFLLHAVRRLAWDLGVRRRLWGIQLVTILVVLVPCFQWGHFEDVIALTCVVHAVRRLLRAEHLQAALMLSVAVASKEWAIMLVPLVVWLAPPGRRLRCLIAAAALPSALVLFPLGVDWSDASKAFFSPLNGGTTGHVAFYANWLGTSTSRLTRSVGLLCAPILAWWAARWVRAAPAVLAAPAVIAAAALLLGIRPLFEVVNFSYYFSPGLLLAGLVGVAVHRRFLIRDWVLPMVAVLWALPHGNAATTNGWYAGEAILMALIAAQVLSHLGVDISLRQRFRKARKEPMFLDMAMPTGAGEKSWNR